MTLNGMEAIRRCHGYCTAATTPWANKPQIGFGGTPSPAVNDFVIECIGGIEERSVLARAPARCEGAGCAPRRPTTASP
jgi:hypothetical protein